MSGSVQRECVNIKTEFSNLSMRITRLKGARQSSKLFLTPSKFKTTNINPLPYNPKGVRKKIILLKSSYYRDTFPNRQLYLSGYHLGM